MNWFFYAIYAKKCCRLFLSLRSHFYMLQKCMYTDTVNNIYGTTSMCYDVHSDLVINPPRGVVGYETAWFAVFSWLYTVWPQPPGPGQQGWRSTRAHYHSTTVADKAGLSPNLPSLPPSHYLTTILMVRLVYI